MECCGRFIVKFLETWAEAALGEVVAELGESLGNIVVRADFHRLGEYGVTIVVIKWKNVLVASIGSDSETAG